MKELVYGTAAYKIFCGDAEADRLSHAYMLYFADSVNLRNVLKLFALRVFNTSEEGRDGRLILSEGLADCRIYPLPDGKLNTEAAASIVDDSALRPVEHGKKLYVISGFESASPIFQNKLLKVLEEPPEGVCFLIGATSLAPVLDTVKSRVKLLEIPPFTEDEIFGALERAGKNPQNRAAASSCGGILGAAQTMLEGGWFIKVKDAAEELCGAATAAQAAEAALKHGDCKYKRELLGEMQKLYFEELKKYAADADYRGRFSAVAVNYALKNIGGALADVKFNANFSSLLYDFTLRVAAENCRKKG